MQPPTEAIYETIRTTPLDIVLKAGLCTKFRPSVKLSTEKLDTERRCNSVQFNLRIFEKDMLDFVRFCETHGFSRKEGFALLMNCCPGINGNDRSPEEEIIKLLKSKLDDHTAQLELTQDKLTKLNTDIRSDTRYRSLLDSMQALLQKYCRLILPEDAQLDEELRICKYHDIPDVDKYEYPSEDQGIMAITLDGLAYGRGRSPAIFIFAKTEDGSLVKFRYYSKRDYIGISIPHSDWAFPEAKWLVTWQKAKDGAIDLKGSIPIPLNLTDTAADDHTDDLDNYPDLLFSEDILYELYEPEPIPDPELLYPVISHDTVSFEDILIDPEPCDIPKSAAKKSTTVIADDFQNNEDPTIEKDSLDALIRHAQAKHRK